MSDGANYWHAESVRLGAELGNELAAERKARRKAEEKHGELLDELAAERQARLAEREEWNKMFGVKHPQGQPLSPKDAALLKAIFTFDPKDFDEVEMNLTERARRLVGDMPWVTEHLTPNQLADLPRQIETCLEVAVDQERQARQDADALYEGTLKCLAAATEARQRALASVDGIDLREGHILDNSSPDELRDKLYGAGLKISQLEEARQKAEAEAAAMRPLLEAYLEVGENLMHLPRTVKGPDELADDMKKCKAALSTDTGRALAEFMERLRAAPCLGTRGPCPEVWPNDKDRWCDRCEARAIGGRE